MRRWLIAILLAGLAPVPASAATVNGSVMLPTFGTPAPTRMGWQVPGNPTQGVTGYVFALSTRGSFTLRRTGGLTGMEDFDIVFYVNLDGPTGTAAGPAMCATTNPVCTGVVPSNANWAIVTLSVGLSGTFTYSNP